MAQNYSPKIITDGLAMCLDASQNKSYPTTDLPVKNGLLLWLDASDDTTFSYSSGTTVSQWRDKSGLNNHVAQSTVANQPSRSSTLNSRKIIVFDGSNDSLSAANSLDLSTTHTIFAIASQSVGSSDAGLVSINNTLNNGMTLHNASGYYAYFGSGAYYATSSITGSTSYIFTKIFKGSSSTTRQIYLNGTSATSSGTITSTDASGVIRLGQQATYLNGTIAEVIIFNRELTATELKQVHTYLGQKWGVVNTDRSIIDLAGNDDNGLLGNGATANMPVYNYYNKGGLRFNSSFSNYVISPNTTISGSQTFCVWAVMTGKQNSPTGVLSQHDYASTANFGINIITSNQLAPSIGYTNGTREYQDKTTTATISYNQIFNAVLVYNAGLNRIYWYINGVLDSQYALSLTPKSTNWPIGLGRWDPSYNNYYFDGTIFSALIYNKALSAAEVAQNYEAQKSKFANTIVQQGLILNIDIDNPYSYAGAGTTVYDVSPTALTWTATNTTYNPSPIKYLSYNGSSSSLVSSTSSAYDSQTITMECWCYPNTLSQLGFLFEKGAVNTQYSMFFESVTNPNFVFRTMGSVSNQNLVFNPNTYLTVSAWNHIVCTYDGSSKIAYVNGVQVASAAASGTLPTGGTNQYIGKYGAAGDNYPFNGRIAESRVYNIALTAAQVLQNYNTTRTKYGL